MLQKASIEYLRYLEQCVSNLKAANSSITQPSPPSLKASFSAEEVCEGQEADEEDDEDQEMEDTPTETPQSASTYRSTHSFPDSPALSVINTSSSYASSVTTLPRQLSGPVNINRVSLILPQHPPQSYPPVLMTQTTRLLRHC